MDNNSRKYLYTKCVFTYIIKNNYLIGCLYVIDFIALLSFLTLAPRKLININKTFEDETSIVFIISPYNLYKKYVNTDNNTYMIAVISIVIALMIGYYFLLLTLNKDLVNSKENKKVIFKSVYVNFYEIILFRFLTIYIIDSYVTAIVKFIYKTYEGKGNIYAIVIFFLCIVLFYLLYDNVNHFTTHAVIANLKAYPETLGNFPFDLNFSNNYDIVTLIVKLFLFIEKKVFKFRNNIVTYRIFFLNLIQF